MKKLAARDFEDLLQCSLPVFEGLFEEPHNKIILDLLFSLAIWHSLAKLRMHNDSTLKHFEDETQTIGKQLRHFKQTTCSAFRTRELPSEVRKRGRKALKKAATAGIVPSATNSATEELGESTACNRVENKPGDEPRLKELNLNTVKIHTLGEYVSHIRQFGTTDSYSTQIVVSISSFTFFLVLILLHYRVN